MRMKMNQEKIDAFNSNFTRKRDAIFAVMSALGCSESKAKKICLGSYPSGLALLERLELAKLFRCREEELFHRVDASRKGTTRRTAS
jgi:hypothetical protein